MEERQERIELVEKLKSEYVGKWIGLRDATVIAVSETHELLLERLKEKHVDGVYVFYSPTDKEREYGFLFVAIKCGSESENFSAG